MSLPRPVAAVVFDLDGLLIDSESLLWVEMEAVAREMGAELPFATFQGLLGRTHAQNNAALALHFGQAFALADFHAEVSRRVRAVMALGVALKAGAVELLDHLAEAGLPRAIATSSAREHVDLHLEPAFIGRFQTIVTRDLVSNFKPHPEPYLKAAEALGIAPELCLALEDSHNGVRSAAAAGMMTIMVPDLLDATEEMHGLCVRIAADLHEVRMLLGPVRP